MKEGGISFLGCLTLIFITLKLCGLIGWSWFWVLLPVFIPLLLASAFLGGLALVCAVIFLFRRFMRRRKNLHEKELRDGQ
jgi:membrane protein implicated in regulation of membrane protease activity